MNAPIACVIDASVGIKLAVTEADSDKAQALFEHLARDPAARFFAPDLFDIECANILWKYFTRTNYPPADAHLNMTSLVALALRRIPVSTVACDALRIALQHGTSAYDASYLAIEEREGVPLVTADTKLVTKMSGTGIAVLDLATLTIPPCPPSPVGTP